MTRTLIEGGYVVPMTAPAAVLAPAVLEELQARARRIWREAEIHLDEPRP